MRGLTVLYDDRCRLCTFVAGWLRRQRQLVPLALVPVGSEQARTWFPGLDHDGAARREVTVVGDGGQVYLGDSAWVVCLWALADHRAFAHTLTTPGGRRLARAAVLTASRYRQRAGKEPERPRARAVRQPPRLPGAPGAGAGPAWEYDGSGGWTLRDTAAGIADAADDPADACTDGCSPPG
ncbi:thiol-disulfide oxidoreductase DCC family protein [Streptomyces sp. NPDC020917]|uniref:thiol-disulfide oxidoreductase DCC family protein n=1 Tax=Streptomyces sp. NPDC020917 TaxID=3365102 RepID=UPI0037A2633E